MSNANKIELLVSSICRTSSLKQQIVISELVPILLLTRENGEQVLPVLCLVVSTDGASSKKVGCKESIGSMHWTHVGSKRSKDFSTFSLM